MTALERALWAASAALLVILLALTSWAWALTGALGGGLLGALVAGLWLSPPAAEETASLAWGSP